MDLSRLRPAEAVGATASALLIASLFLKWFSLSSAAVRDEPGDWACGQLHTACSGFATFPILRWLLIAAASAPLILAWIVIRGHKLSWPPGEMTAVVGLTATVLIGFNGVIQKPIDIGITIAYGYVVALLAALGIAAAGIWRSLESGAVGPRKPPGVM